MNDYQQETEKLELALTAMNQQKEILGLLADMLKVRSALCLPLDGTQDVVAEIIRVMRENDTLRKLLADSNAPCPYCGLAASDQSKCVRGFPGCARADDQLLPGYESSIFIT